MTDDLAKGRIKPGPDRLIGGLARPPKADGRANLGGDAPTTLSRQTDTGGDTVCLMPTPYLGDEFVGIGDQI